jgi:hypothetical protein
MHKSVNPARLQSCELRTSQKRGRRLATFIAHNNNFQILQVIKRQLKRRRPILKLSLTFQEIFMPKFVIERAIPGVGATKPAELQAISQKSCSVLQELGPDVQWVHSYVTGDKIYCIYNAANEDLVREHARRGGFPANSVSRVMSVIDPTTAEA